MLKAIFEGKLDIFLKAPEGTVLSAGTLVKLDTAKEGYFAVAGVGDEPYGILAQDVVGRGTDNFKLDSVTHKAYYNEKAGVYFDGGMYYTDNTSSAVTVGAKLYGAAGGKLSATVPGSGFTGAVAIAETAGASGTKVRIRFLK